MSEMPGALPAALNSKAEAVRRGIQQAGSLLVAYSGGVDSTLLAELAHQAVGGRMLSVTADSETIYPGEVDEARLLARARGWRHLIVRRSELADPAFAANPDNRCFHCKDDLFALLGELASARGLDAVAEGTNASDLTGHRPGYAAARKHAVMSPFVDAGLTKPEIRTLARAYGLPNAEKPGLACLSSRFPTGQLITVAGLDRVARAEALVRRALGVELVRVRDLAGSARIEVAPEAVGEASRRRAELEAALVAIGFVGARVAQAGYRSVETALPSP